LRAPTCGCCGGCSAGNPKKSPKWFAAPNFTNPLTYPHGKLTTSKWAAIAKCSPDTALRDISQLLDLGVLQKTPGGGRSTGYTLAG
jgi:hypothetical protein